jgi:pimeloyl-ACP methyl ester carboxylesterase
VPVTVRVRSGDETLQADLYGVLPARRAVILVHGQQWDGSGWRDVAPRFAERGVPALALNLRGYDGSSGTTDEWAPPAPWSPVIDLRATKALLRERGAREVALVGASMGGHAVLASSFEGDIECVVSISAPVVATDDDLSRRITGRKLFVCASDDASGAMPHVSRAFAVASSPKTMLAFGGKEHSRGMFAAPYGEEAISAIVEFVAKGLA